MVLLLFFTLVHKSKMATMKFFIKKNMVGIALRGNLEEKSKNFHFGTEIQDGRHDILSKNMNYRPRW